MPPSTALATLGERLRKARIEAGLSQAQLGAPHFTRAHISAIEMGKVRPALRSLEFLSRKLDRPAGYFLGEGSWTGPVRPELVGPQDRHQRVPASTALREREHALVRKALRFIAEREYERAAATLERVLQRRPGA